LIGRRPERVIAALVQGPDDIGVRHVVSLVAMLALAALLAATSTAAPATTATQLTKRFKAVTGQKLVASKSLSYAGHYKAYDLGVSSVANRAIWGNFTVFLVTASDVDADVKRLLSDTHTGALGQPGAGSIYWEQGVTLQGVQYWQAKRRYGLNVVLKWTGASGQKKTDATWKRLHKALTAATK
jgi:hypothetical protein